MIKFLADKDRGKEVIDMMLTRFNPVRELTGIQREINRLFEDFFGETFERGIEKAWGPAVDITEDGKNIYLKADLPGMNQKDIKVSVEDDVLTISGERKSEREEKKDGKFYRLERVYGQFCRSFTLPDNVDATKISAEYKDGVLTLTIPKTEEKKSKAIEIEVK
ncbi:MAG: Hsp20/alpha crystallin family protein [Myxococcota bacterium]